MSHTHHPDGTGPVCRYTTKRECDAAWSAYQANRKTEYEAKLAQTAAQRLLEREQAYLRFQESERRRIAEGRPPC